MTTKRKKGAAEAPTTFPPTTLRLDPELVYRAKRLALDNARVGTGHDRTVSQVMNAALSAYLKARGA